MEILTEIFLPDSENENSINITESQAEGSPKQWWIKGVFMEAERKNRNRRTYPIKEIAEAVKSAQETIRNCNGIFGELDHPKGLQINMDRVSHAIKEIKMVGNDAIGSAVILGTPMGLIAQELIKSGVKFGISSRGAGEILESGIVSGYNFVTADLVTVPSAHGAYPTPVYESLEKNLHGKEAIKLSKVVREDASAQKFFEASILKFIKQL